MVYYRSIFTCFVGWILFCFPFALLPTYAVTLQFSSTDLPAGNCPRSAILVDLDRNGHRDLVVANLRGSNISLLFGDGAGSFSLTLFLGDGTLGLREVFSRQARARGGLQLRISTKMSMPT